MKLRYYLRGLGIGIVVTALIMGISGRDARPLTDAEIKAKAAALGMVESESLKLSDVMQKPSPESTQEPEVSGGESETSGEGTTQKTEISGTESSQKPAEVPPAESPKEPETTGAESPSESESVAVTIISGSDSGTVSRQLEEAGLIESAAAFDRYLIDNGYSKRISADTYEFQPGTSEEEIARIITKTR